MRAKNIYINVQDITRLSESLRVARMRYEEDTAHLTALAEDLNRAVVVLPDRIPPDVVTMYSRVLLRDLASGKEIECVVVFPKDVDVIAGMISVVEPIGAAILGRRVGDVIRIKVPAGARKMRIERILHQPEAAAMLSSEACA